MVIKIIPYLGISSENICYKSMLCNKIRKKRKLMRREGIYKYGTLIFFFK